MSTAQTDPPTSAASLDLTIGSPVECHDGGAGRLLRVVIDPGPMRVTAVVVERGLRHAAVVVPSARVAGVVDGLVQLDMDTEEFARLPHYADVDYARPDPGWEARHGYAPESTLVRLRGVTPAAMISAPSGLWIHEQTHLGLDPAAVPLRRGTHITGHDGPVGHLDHVLLDAETEAIQALVVRQGHLLPHDVLIPATWVQRVSEEEICLTADRTLLAHLPQYQPAHADEQITAAVQAALATHAATRGASDMSVQTRAGVVQVQGVVRTEEAKQAVTALAAAQPGVWEVTNDLLAESALTQAISTALARDPRTTRAVLEVSCEGGSVTVRGTVRNAAEQAAALAIAQAVPGVAAVIDELEVRADAGRLSWPEATAESLQAVAGPFGVWRHV